MRQVALKHLMEKVVPILTALKHVLERAHSPLLRELMFYFGELFRYFTQQFSLGIRGQVGVDTGSHALLSGALEGLSCSSVLQEVIAVEGENHVLVV